MIGVYFNESNNVIKSIKELNSAIEENSAITNTNIVAIDIKEFCQANNIKESSFNSIINNMYSKEYIILADEETAENLGITPKLGVIYFIKQHGCSYLSYLSNEFKSCCTDRVSKYL